MIFRCEEEPRFMLLEQYTINVLFKLRINYDKAGFA